MTTAFYINTATGEWPVFKDTIKKAFPNVSFPANFVPPEGFAEVVDSPPPSISRFEKVVELEPIVVDGKYTRQWEVVQLTQEESDTVLQQLKTNIINEAQMELDSFARTRGYDGIMSLCSYSNSGDTTFASEAATGVSLRDATWRTLYTILTDVENGSRSIPLNYNEIKPELPQLVW